MPMSRLLAFLAATLLVASTAQSASGAQDLAGRVRDLAEILHPEVEARLDERLAEAERIYGPQVGIATIPSLGGQSIEQFALDYANAWGLGDAMRDDGILILVAPNDRSARIEIGLGIEQDYPAAWAQEVLSGAALPHFREGDYGRGLEGAVDMIIARMQRYPTAPANDDTPAKVNEAA